MVRVACNDATKRIYAWIQAHRVTKFLEPFPPFSAIITINIGYEKKGKTMGFLKAVKMACEVGKFDLDAAVKANVQ